MEWQTVQKTGRRRDRSDQQPEEVKKSIRDVKKFLSSFKTQPCNQELRHDWSQCSGYHGKGSDKRRNPYTVAYLPDDPGLTGTEKAYHPLNFRTKYCEPILSGRKCKYGEFCAFAHDETELQQPTYEEEMKNHLYPTQPRPQISEYVPHLRDPEPVCPPEIHSLHSLQIPQQPRSQSFDIPLRLTSWEVVVLQHSKVKLWEVLTETALRDLCKLQLAQDEQHTFLQIRGQNAREARDKLLACFRPMPTTYVLQMVKQYSTRIIKLLFKRLETHGTKYFTHQNSKDLQIFINEITREVTVCALALKDVMKPQEIFDKIDFWIRETELGQVVSCCACMDDFNPDEGVKCSGKEQHFFCACECLESLVEAQIASIMMQGGHILCPICKHEVESSDIAKSCQKETWRKFQDAVVDARVASHTKHLQEQFDERLQKKVDELMASYGNEDEQVKLQAEGFAREARNQALNLHCPHCKQVYSEFDGCMALQCAHCKGDFCGYCHKATGSSKGAHDHVRECDANLTSNGSYYATAEQIREAQRRFRVKQLKRFFEEKKMKQRIRNATIIELAKDLDDLKVDPAALFNFGNLQG